MLNINYFVLEPGIEPGATRWQRIIFPLNYTSIKYNNLFYALFKYYIFGGSEENRTPFMRVKAACDTITLQNLIT